MDSGNGARRAVGPPVQGAGVEDLDHFAGADRVQAGTVPSFVVLSPRSAANCPVETSVVGRSSTSSNTEVSVSPGITDLVISATRSSKLFTVPALST
jgi:hypothetical protein